MCSHQVTRLLWCASLERKGCGSTLGQQELAVATADVAETCSTSLLSPLGHFSLLRY